MLWIAAELQCRRHAQWLETLLNMLVEMLYAISESRPYTDLDQMMVGRYQLHSQLQPDGRVERLAGKIVVEPNDYQQRHNLTDAIR